ncbi:hypothetical protein PM082_014614 [Marasmius tenuissimus]|nr:hypothetical protein PM082_014614 [Marasmius tenuissimus]
MLRRESVLANRLRDSAYKKRRGSWSSGILAWRVIESQACSRRCLSRTGPERTLIVAHPRLLPIRRLTLRIFLQAAVRPCDTFASGLTERLEKESTRHLNSDLLTSAEVSRVPSYRHPHTPASPIKYPKLAINAHISDRVKVFVLQGDEETEGEQTADGDFSLGCAVVAGLMIPTQNPTRVISRFCSICVPQPSTEDVFELHAHKHMQVNMLHRHAAKYRCWSNYL